MALLFGRNNRGGNQPKNLVEFRAGKMSLKGNMVHPDKRKGLVYVYQSDDGLTHFCWKDRTSNVVEDDLIIFPDDAVFAKVTQCKEDARVFLLKFKASSRKLFYWMQEPKTEVDSDLTFKVNEAINNPGSAGSRGGTNSASTPTASEQEMHNLLQSMSQSQLMQLLGGMNDLDGAQSLLSQMGLGQLGALGGEGRSGNGSGSSVPATGNSTSSSAPSATSGSVKKEESSTPASKPSASSSKPNVQLQDLQKILSGMQSPPSAVDLAAGINSEFVKRITSCPTTVQKLTPLLPKFGFTGSAESAAEAADPQGVSDTLISPAFQNALSSFCSAFPSGQLGPLIEQFQFGTDAVKAAQSGNLEAFINAIQKEVDNKSQGQGSAEKSEDMNVD